MCNPVAQPAPNFQQNIAQTFINVANRVSVAITALVIGLCRSTCMIVTIICVKYTINWETTLIPSPYTHISSVDVIVCESKN